MLSNFNEPIWPRTIATKFTNGAQIPAHNKEDALQLYKDSNFIDCRISAYPYNNNNNNNNDSCNNHTKSQVVNFILIDIDISIFNNSKQALDKQLNRILKNINKVFGLVPSVVWSSNGYHIYIQIEPLNTTLEETPEFSRFKEPSKEFLRFV